MLILATVAVDHITAENREVVWKAISDLCHPASAGGFASCGIYSFWCPRTNELLYVAPASDVASRVGQHLGLVDCDSRGSKRRVIEKFLELEGTIGVGLLMMSPTDGEIMPIAGRLPARAEILKEIEQSLGPEAKNTVVFIEQTIIQRYYDREGVLPRWNRFAAKKLKGERENTAPECIVDALSGRFDEAYTARLPIRELAVKPEAQIEKFVLHPARMLFPLSDGTFVDHIEYWLDLPFAGDVPKSLMKWAHELNYLNLRPLQGMNEIAER